jgi:hypothetical protein
MNRGRLVKVGSSGGACAGRLATIFRIRVIAAYTVLDVRMTA